MTSRMRSETLLAENPRLSPGFLKRAVLRGEGPNRSGFAWDAIDRWYESYVTVSILYRHLAEAENRQHVFTLPRHAGRTRRRR